MASEVKYPVARTVRLKESTDEKLVEAAKAKDVKPAVLERMLIEEALEPTQEQPNA